MIILAAAALLAAAPPAGSPPAPPEIFLTEFSGQALIEMCDGAGRPYCNGYISAATDVLTRHRQICRPIGTTTTQLVATVTDYIRPRPERWHVQAAFLIEEALVLAFPC